jgi:glycosyltransferase involved in cell wall biosynthesis
MKLSIIVPCFNEADTICKLIKLVDSSSISNKEIIIVDDCSTDGTRDILQHSIACVNSDLKIFYHDVNKGKGAALRTGFAAVTGDVVLIQDADLEYSPSDYNKILSPIINGDADVVYGSRFIGGDSRRVLFFWHSLGNKFLTIISNIFTNLNLTDMETCYKVFKTDILAKINLKENRFGFEPEITAKLSKLNLHIYEVGITYRGRTYKEGKKIGWLDGISALYCILRYNIFSDF